MKNVSYVINGVLAVAIIILFILFFTTGKGNNDQAASLTFNGSDSTALLPLAYVNIDSLLVSYDYAKDVNDQLTKKMEDVRASINQKGKKLEKEMQEFERKYQNNAFLTPERAQQEATRIQKMQQDLEQSSQRLQNEWAMDQHKENMKIADSVRIGVELYNQTANIQLVFNMRELDNIIVGNPKYDITQKVLGILNGRYKPENKK